MSESEASKSESLDKLQKLIDDFEEDSKVVNINLNQGQPSPTPKTQSKSSIAAVVTAVVVGVGAAIKILTELF